MFECLSGMFKKEKKLSDILEVDEAEYLEACRGVFEVISSTDDPKELVIKTIKVLGLEDTPANRIIVASILKGYEANLIMATLGCDDD